MEFWLVFIKLAGVIDKLALRQALQPVISIGRRKPI
jgi:hypothetical protein